MSGGGVVRVFISNFGAPYAFDSLLPISVGAGDRVGSDLDAAYLTFNRLAVLVGAEGEDEAYYVLVNPDDTFENVTPLSVLVTPSSGFGRSVSMSGDRLLIGSDDDLYVMQASHTGVDTVTTTGGFALDPTITGVAIEGRFGAAVPPFDRHHADRSHRQSAHQPRRDPRHVRLLPVRQAVQPGGRRR